MNTALRRITGIAAIVLLAVLLVGVPALLWTVGKPLIPTEIPSLNTILDALLSRDDGSLVAGLLYIVAWLAWAYLAVALIMEIWAAIRRVNPPKLTGFSLPQGIARPLVAAAMLAFVAGPTLAGTSHAAPIPTDAVDGPGVSQAQPAKAGAVQERESVSKVTHTVGPADSLSSLAKKYLGDEDRYPEIFEANKGITQANGAALTDPDLIVDGTKLTIPIDAPDTPAPKTSTPTTQPDSNDNSSSPTKKPTPTPTTSTTPKAEQPQHGTASAATATPAPEHDPSQPRPVPTPATSQPSNDQHRDRAQIQHDDDLDEDDAIGLRTMFGAGAVLAVGVIGLIGRRRFMQRRQRSRGAELAMPEGPAAAIEQEMRTAQNPMAVEEVDLALRSLAHHCRQQHLPLPEIRIARFTSAGLELYLTEPQQLPEPWVGAAADVMWSFQAANVEELDAETLREFPAPYPSLVCLGQDLENAHILVDLETVGELSITGDSQQAQEVIAAIAMELATSHWADDLTVTLVGAFAEMEDTLQTGRIRYLPTAGRLFDELTARAQQDRAALNIEHAADAHHARITAVAPSTWFPEIVILTQPLTPEQQQQLDQLLTELPRIAVASIAINDHPGDWTLQLGNGEDHATLQPVGLALTAQHLERDAYRQILDIVDVATYEQPIQNELTPSVVSSLLDGADQFLHDHDHVTPQDDTTKTPEDAPTLTATNSEDTTLEPLEEEPDPHIEPITAAAPPQLGPVQDQPYLQILGHVELIGAEGSVEPQRKNRLTEYLAYLVLSEGEATAESIDDAIWPNRKKQNNSTTRDPATSRLRKWLGTMPQSDEPRLSANTYELEDDAIGCDWFQFRSATDGNLADIPTEHLSAALQLVRGLPFKGVSVRYYGWAEPLQQEMITRIVDVCYELATRQLVDEQWLACEHTLTIGLDVEPGDEQLWRMRITAAYARHNQQAVDEAIDRLFAQLEAFDTTPEPTTDAFLKRLREGAAVIDLMEMI